jgi:hypothetical protein
MSEWEEIKRRRWREKSSSLRSDEAVVLDHACYAAFLDDLKEKMRIDFTSVLLETSQPTDESGKAKADSSFWTNSRLGERRYANQRPPAQQARVMSAQPLLGVLPL